MSNLCVSKLCVSKQCVSKLCVCKLCVSKLCVSKLYVSKLCVSKLCVCVSKLCVCASCVRPAAGRREEDGKTDGMQNQKQEPHTKMWGIKGPDNPTCQLLPSSPSRCEIEMGEARKKGDGASQLGWVKELCVTVLCVCV